MNNRQIRLIQESYTRVFPNSGHLANLFYMRLFELDPSLRTLFKDDMTEQKAKLIDMLSFIVDSLLQLDDLIPAVQALGQRHVGYRVQAQDYEPLGKALLWALEQTLGAEFTPELRAAWVGVYTVLANTMIQVTSNGE